MKPPSSHLDVPTVDELKVPSGRFSRFVELSRAAGSMMASGAMESVKRLSDRAGEGELPHVLLTGKSARLLAKRLSRLRGAAMKVGQMLSLEGDNLLPAEFAQALEILRSSAHRMPDAQVVQMLREEYGNGYDERFLEFDFTPIASASIGQVHRAVTHEGREIVLKIQYPGVSESIESDVDNLRSLLALTRLVPSSVDLVVFAEEVKKELRQEVDYEREQEMLLRYRAHIGGDERFLLPEPIRAHSRSRILAMERLFCVPLLHWAQEAPQEERDQVGTHLFELLLRELLEFRFSQTDPNPANFQYDVESKRVVLLDFGAAREVSQEVSYVYRSAFEGLLHRDASILRKVVSDLGVHNPELPEATELIVELALESAEAFDEETYDFAATDLQKRLNERGRKMARYHGRLNSPPAQYLFFQRKLTGTFLLCRQIEARVPCRALVESILRGTRQSEPSTRERLG